MKHLLADAPVIAVLPMHETYDKSGREELLYKAEGRKVWDGKIQAGHAVLFTGWGYKSDNTLFWEYLNSYGETFGRDGGFGEVLHNKFTWAYAINQVTVEDPTVGVQ